jgi:hypothetical protein
MNQHPSSAIQSTSLSIATTRQPHPLHQNAYGGPLFDPSDPALFNFDISSLNFGNHYGALEFGMLGHMSSGAAETPPGDNTVSQIGSAGTNFTPSTAASTGFSTSPGTSGSYLFSQDTTMVGDWQGGDSRQGNASNVYDMQRGGLPPAFAIGAGPASLASPSNSASSPQRFDQSPMSNQYPNQHQQVHRQQSSQRTESKSTKTTPPFGPQGVLGKRPRNPSSIYESVKQPYSYTAGFHSLTEFLQRRFSPNKTLRIAKALASIRPSFISCTKTLNREDLIFMEKCFQRTLWEYEDFINACGTPTIVCRRTGEIAAVGKEFSLLTGWKKDVLLGKEANLNINTGANTSNTGNVPKVGPSASRVREEMRQDREVEAGSRPQPVFLAELLDDESVIDFYEDFAKLAFGDSRGSVTTRCKLLKYRTKDGEVNVADVAGDGDSEVKKEHQRKSSAYLKGQRIDNEQGMAKLQKDGKVDCSCCWTVKKDVFDLPMLIVMNVSLVPLHFSTRWVFFWLTMYDSSYLAFDEFH